MSRNPPAPPSAAEQEIVERLIEAYETSDLEGVGALPTDEVIVPRQPDLGE
ncbi:MAG TPA: hypothetical protein VNC61_10025 [Acidimicrobiales bacterium]|nr:hypothetical protein [Acidimicrobiales bacterium]